MVIVKERKEEGRQEGGGVGGVQREGKKRKVSKEKGVPLRET